CAGSGKFSTDRTIDDYNNEIWKLEKISVDNEF
ncbi:MAG: glycogen/starch/alpha-glucan phosphorylase, partial [Methylobacter sp.]|nr:glycogen/starch/alpha-glucan phosphorylase [Methylobacter sp.]